MAATIPNPECSNVSCIAPPYLGITDKNYLQCPSKNLVFFNSTSDPSNTIANVQQVIGCKSDCSVFETDEACCMGQFDTSAACPSTNPWFKSACPNAYSYAFDDAVTRFCSDIDEIEITFCPVL